ncbi:hypothetical protein A6R68_03733, partial [Neotoma lepida]
MELITQETSLSDSQERAVPDSKEVVYKVDGQVKTLIGQQTLVIHTASIEGRHVTSFNGEQTWDVGHLVTSVLDQTIKEEHQEMSVSSGDQIFDCSHMATRVGKQITCEGTGESTVGGVLPKCNKNFVRFYYLKHH